MSLLQGNRERKLEWYIAGRTCQGTPDAFTEEWLTELKVTNDASPGRVPFHARKMGWLAQLAWYRSGIARAMGFTPRETYLVAVESKRPYPVTCFKLDASALDCGERQWRLWWEQLMACEQSDSWPAYTEALVPLSADSEDLGLVFGDEDEAA